MLDRIKQWLGIAPSPLLLDTVAPPPSVGQEAAAVSPSPPIHSPHYLIMGWDIPTWTQAAAAVGVKFDPSSVDIGDLHAIRDALEKAGG